MSSERSVKNITIVKKGCVTAAKKKYLISWNDNERVEEGEPDNGCGLLKTCSLFQWSSFREELTTHLVGRVGAMFHCSRLSRCITCISAY